MFCWGYYIKESKSCTAYLYWKAWTVAWYPGEMCTCSSGLKPSYGLIFAPTLKRKMSKVESFLSLLLPCLGQVHSPACPCGSRWTVLCFPKSYRKLCLLFWDSCNALPKFRRIGWRALRPVCSNLVDSLVVLLLNWLLSQWNFSHCLGIFYYFI